MYHKSDAIHYSVKMYLNTRFYWQV